PLTLVLVCDDRAGRQVVEVNHGRRPARDRAVFERCDGELGSFGSPGPARQPVAERAANGSHCLLLVGLRGWAVPRRVAPGRAIETHSPCERGTEPARIESPGCEKERRRLESCVATRVPSTQPQNEARWWDRTTKKRGRDHRPRSGCVTHPNPRSVVAGLDEQQ